MWSSFICELNLQPFGSSCTSLGGGQIYTPRTSRHGQEDDCHGTSRMGCSSSRRTQTNGSAGGMHSWTWRLAVIPVSLDQSPDPRSMHFQMQASKQLDQPSHSACSTPINPVSIPRLDLCRAVLVVQAAEKIVK